METKSVMYSFVKDLPVDLQEETKNLQRTLITAAMMASGGNMTAAAKLLKLQRTTLVMKMKTLGMQS